MTTISTKPWSDFKESDYDDAQWLRACLIDRGPDAGSAKQRGSLPVREPDGTLNKNAVHSAAAALAGARGGVKAAPELKKRAAAALVRLYAQLDEDPPESVTSLAHAEITVDTILSHSGLLGGDPLTGPSAKQHGIKGQKWGVRRKPSAVTGLVSRTSSPDQIAQDRIAKKIAKGGIESLSNTDIQAYTRRLQMHEELSRALARQSAETKKKSDSFIKRFIMKQGGRQFDRVANKAIDIAIEAAIRQAGVKVGASNPALGKGIQETSRRLKPKK